MSKRFWSAAGNVALFGFIALLIFVEVFPEKEPLRMAFSSGSHGQLTWISANGPLDAGAAGRFEKFLESEKLSESGYVAVFLNSEEGSVSAAMELGYIIRRRGFNTGVGKGYRPWFGAPGLKQGRCTSVCLLALLGGVFRYTKGPKDIGLSFLLSKGNLVGEDNQEPHGDDFNNLQAGMAVRLKNYVAEMGADSAILSLAPESTTRFFSEDELRKFGITNAN